VLWYRKTCALFFGVRDLHSREGKAVAGDNWLSGFHHGRREALVFACLGAVSGVATALIQPFGGLLFEPVKEIAASSKSLRLIWEVIGTFAPGLLFGALIGWWIHRTQVRSLLRWIGFAVATTVSWYAAIYGAIEVDGWFAYSDPRYAVPGLAGGLIGSLITALGAAALYPFARRYGIVLAMVIMGTGAGALLHAERLVLFPVWQAAVAACLGIALHRARRASGPARASAAGS
jgi:hypothetical protein